MKKRLILSVLAVAAVVLLAILFIPTGPSKLDVPGATVSAAITTQDGGKSSLSVTVSDGFAVYSETFGIEGNTADTYKVGDNEKGTSEFYVYIKTGGGKVNKCYFVNTSELVWLAEGSYGVAGKNKITGLAPGYYYTVEAQADSTMYVAKDGSLSSDPAQLGLLATTEISGLLSRQVYVVSRTAEYPLAGGSLTSEMLEQIDVICRKYLYDNYTSMAVSVLKDGQIHYLNFGTMQSSRDTGFENEADRKYVDENSVYEIASLSKPFAAVLLAYFDRQGWLSMKDAVSMYFPQLPDYIDANGSHIAPTLEDLSAHTAGFPRMPRNWQPGSIDNELATPYEYYTRERLEQELGNMVYDFKPGTVNSYSNFGVGVLGNVLTDVYFAKTGNPRYDGKALGHYGQAYGNLLGDLLAGPLGLSSTMIIADDDMTSRKTLPHNGFGARAYEWHFDALAACGGVKSTSRDLALWMAFHVGDYIPSGELFETVAEVMIPRANLDNMGRSFNGLGWMVQPNRPVRTADLKPTGVRYGTLMYHNGAVGGYSTEYMCVPEARAGVVCLMNNSNQFNLVDPLCAEIIDVLLSGNTAGTADSLVKLAPGSEGQPGDRCVTGLEPGYYYTFEISTTTPYKTISTYLFTTQNGTVTDDPSQAGALSGSVITHENPGSGIRLLNGQTYKVTKSMAPPASVKNFEDEVYNLAQTVLAENKLPGMALAYSGDNFDKIGTVSVGYCETENDSAGEKTPITGETLFELGGAGNMFTATLYQLMLQKGIIDGTQTVGDYFPATAKYYGVIWPTLQNLATNKSGMPNWPAGMSDIKPANYTKDDLTNDLAALVYTKAPGSAGNSSFAIGLLCVIMTDAYNGYYGENLTYNEILHKELFEPLGMTMTSVRGEGLSGKVARPHTSSGASSIYLDFGLLGQPSEVYSTSMDMGIWLKAFIEAVRYPQDEGTIRGAMKASQLSEGNLIFRLSKNDTFYYANYRSNGFSVTIFVHIPTWNACTILSNVLDNSFILDNLAGRILSYTLLPRNNNWV